MKGLWKQSPVTIHNKPSRESSHTMTPKCSAHLSTWKSCPDTACSEARVSKPIRPIANQTLEIRVPHLVSCDGPRIGKHARILYKNHDPYTSGLSRSCDRTPTVPPLQLPFAQTQPAPSMRSQSGQGSPRPHRCPCRLRNVKLPASNRTLLGARGLTTRSKDAPRGSWPYY